MGFEMNNNDGHKRNIDLPQSNNITSIPSPKPNDFD